jgi:23S rRNA (adenine1618-N6)-methyltransferase
MKSNGIKKTLSNKPGLHPRNLHRGNYDFKRLTDQLPELRCHLKTNPNGLLTIDFSNVISVKLLNKALLKVYYSIDNWDIPDGYLCPPIPGRADYVHRLADLYSQSQGKKYQAKTLLDIGTGANCIYPLIAASQYGWSVVATDIETKSLNNARNIVQSNPSVLNHITLRHQKDSKQIFEGIIKPTERFDLSMCNPPFHRSQQEANKGSKRKAHNLNKKNRINRSHATKPNQRDQVKLNFGGQSNELWCDGGELAFVKKMATESVKFAEQVLWFSSLLSKSDNIKPLQKHLKALNTEIIQVVEMGQGNKMSRFIAWTFQNEVQRKLWNKSEC